MGFLLKSKAPLSWALAESFGLMLDCCNKLSVVVHCSTMRSPRCSGKLRSALVMPAIKCVFHVLVDFFSQVVAIVMRRDKLKGDFWCVK